jgi:LCP family protein required for cell wall assembly
MTRRPAGGPFVVVARVLAALAAVAVVAGTGMAWGGYHRAVGGITTSQALAGGPSSGGGAQNILIMGLDSRLDQHGNALPQDILDALHAGDENAGGYNANVLIVVHLPGDGSPATAFSIPRDDYVELSGCPDPSEPCEGKIKTAYGLAYQHTLDTIDPQQSSGTSGHTSSHTSATTTGDADPAVVEQSAREAGRRAEIATVRHLLGIPIDHFIEVTLVAFFQIAKVVEPITVCLNEDTKDPYSGADFHQGTQQIDAAQAMAFVRQRRDVNDENFTDMDRTRRQQAFIASLLSALRQSGGLSSPVTLGKLLDVAQQNVAVDAGFDLPGFAQRASALTDSPPSLYTLPITEFGQNPDGEDVNMIDVPTIRAIVHNLVAKDSSTITTTSAPDTAKAASPSGGSGAVLDVVNASNHNGLAAELEKSFATKGFTPGQTSTAQALAAATTIDYGNGAQSAAQALADELDMSATASSTVPQGTVQLTIGTDFPASEYLNDTTVASTPTTTTTTTPVSTVAATASGTYTPAPTDLTHMSASGVPCVK